MAAREEVRYISANKAGKDQCVGTQCRQCRGVWVCVFPSGNKDWVKSRSMEEIYSVDILCINCQNMIRTDLVERHSQVCFVVLPSILALETASALKMIDLKVDKLKSAMEMLDADPSKSLKAQDLARINRLIELSIGLLLTHADNGVEFCRGASAEIAKSLEGFSGALSVLVYSERLRSLAQSSEDLESKLEQQRQEAERLREQVDFYRKQTSELQSQYAKRAVEVDSDVGETQQSGRFTSGFSETVSVDREAESRDDLDAQIREQESEARQKSSEELQRYFYSQCLQIKMTLPARDPAQKIPLKKLFDKAQEQAVPVERWPEFIKEELMRVSREHLQH